MGGRLIGQDAWVLKAWRIRHDGWGFVGISRGLGLAGSSRSEPTPNEDPGLGVGY
jgi:hypothetical protein